MIEYLLYLSLRQSREHVFIMQAEAVAALAATSIAKDTF